MESKKESLRLNYPAYITALNAYKKNDLRSYDRLRVKESLSYTEKRLLELRVLFRHNKWEEAYQKVLNIGTITCPFLDAEKFIIKGYILRNHSSWQEAHIALEQALSLYRLAKDIEGVFLCHYNMSATFNRFGLEEVSTYHLYKAKKFAQTPSNKMLIQRALACKLSAEGEFHQAAKHLDHAFQFKDDVLTTDYLVLQTISADIYFKAGFLDKTLAVLDQLKKSSRNPSHSRSLVDYNILKSWQEKSSLGQAPQTVKKDEEQYWKWEVVSTLIRGDFPSARRYWEKLQQKFPLVYGPNFNPININDRSGIFFTIVTKTLEDFTRSTSFEIPKELRVDSKPWKLLMLLKDSNHPLAKEEIIEAIWKKPYSPQLDSRFYKLIQRLRKYKSFLIENTNARYSISPVDTTRAS